MNYLRRLWHSFCAMPLRESLTASALGTFLGWVLAQAIGPIEHPTVIFISAPLCVVGANLLFSWARLQAKPDIDDRPES